MLYCMRLVRPWGTKPANALHYVSSIELRNQLERQRVAVFVKEVKEPPIQTPGGEIPPETVERLKAEGRLPPGHPALEEPAPESASTTTSSTPAARNEPRSGKRR